MVHELIYARGPADVDQIKYLHIMRTALLTVLGMFWIIGLTNAVLNTASNDARLMDVGVSIVIGVPILIVILYFTGKLRNDYFIYDDGFIYPRPMKGYENAGNFVPFQHVQGIRFSDSGFELYLVTYWNQVLLLEPGRGIRPYLILARRFIDQIGAKSPNLQIIEQYYDPRLSEQDKFELRKQVNAINKEFNPVN